MLFDRVLTLLVESAASEVPLTLCGTAFAFVHLIDQMNERGVLIGLPSASRIMEMPWPQLDCRGMAISITMKTSRRMI